MQVFSCQNVLFGYQSPLRKALTFNINVGEVLRVRGNNGCGKTSLLKVMAGLMPPLYGEIQTSAPVLLDTKRALVPEATVEQMCELWGSESPKLLDSDMPCHALSYGQSRYLKLSLIPHLSADLLLLDEPFNGLSGEYLAEVLLNVRKFLDKGAVVFTSHHNVELDCQELQL